VRRSYDARFLALALLIFASGCAGPIALRPGQASLRARNVASAASPRLVRLGRVQVPEAPAARAALLDALEPRLTGSDRAPTLDVVAREHALTRLRSTVAQVRPRHGQSSRGEGGLIVASGRRGGEEPPPGEPGVLIEATLESADGARLWHGELWVPLDAYRSCPLEWALRLVAELGAEDERFLEPTCAADPA